MNIALVRVLSAARSTLLAACLIAFTGLLSSGCANKSSPPSPEQQYILHTIAYPGETFTIISAWYTGSGQNWRELAAANPEVKPNRLRPGMMIKIPRVLLTRDAALPKSFVDAATSKLRVAAPEKGAEDAAMQPVSNPSVTEPPKATPPVFEEPTNVIQPDTQIEAPVALPVLPDPTVQKFEAPPAASSSSVAAPVTEPVKAVEPEKPVAAASSSSAAPATKEEDHQKTRDQLLKELLQDY